MAFRMPIETSIAINLLIYSSIAMLEPSALQLPNCPVETSDSVLD